MKRLIVKIQKDDLSDPETFEVPGELASADLVPNLTKALNLPSEDVNSVRLEYWLETASGQLIGDAQTLTDLSVRNGGMLIVRHGTTRPPELSTQADSYRRDKRAPLLEITTGDTGPVKGFLRLAVPDGTDVSPARTRRK